MRSSILIFAVALLAGLSCKRSSTLLPLCKTTVAGEAAQEAIERVIPFEMWIEIQIASYNRDTHEAPEVLRDCTGRELSDGALPEGCPQPNPNVTLLPARPFREDDVVIADTLDGLQLIWIKTHHYTNGEAFGVLALTEWVDQGILTHALGSLRAYELRPSLRIESVDGQELLVVESDSCNADQTKCSRVVQFSPLIARRFVDWPLHSESNACLGRARFAYEETRDVELENGLTRQFKVRRRVVFENDQAYVSEQVIADDFDPDAAEKPAHRFRNTVEDRPILVSEGFIQSSAGDWDYLLETTARIRPAAE